MNPKRFWLVLRALMLTLGVVLFSIATASGNVIGMLVWGSYAVVWSVQVWFRRQALRADPQ